MCALLKPGDFGAVVDLTAHITQSSSMKIPESIADLFLMVKFMSMSPSLWA